MVERVCVCVCVIGKNGVVFWVWKVGTAPCNFQSANVQKSFVSNRFEQNIRLGNQYPEYFITHTKNTVCLSESDSKKIGNSSFVNDVVYEGRPRIDDTMY